jgi:para-aminobenzoate synthetase component 1
MTSIATQIQEHSAGVLRVELSAAPEPGDALARLAGLSGRVLLESADRLGRYSMLCADPLMTLRSEADASRLVGAEREPATFADPFAALDALLSRFAMPSPPRHVPFAGGVVGFLSYEAGDALERLPAPPPDDLGMPTAWFGVYDRAILWDRRERCCWAVASILPGCSEDATRERLGALVDTIRAPSRPPRPERPPTPAIPDPDGWRRLATSLDREQFVEGVEAIRARIRAGDLFQANLTRRITASTDLSGEELYARLVAESPAGFAAYMDVGEGEVASVSPELFLSKEGRGVRTRPIKGTAGRGGTAAEDRQLASALLASGKDRAENVMIVDLLRNDLSRVCRPGSVHVPELAVLETHPTVHHLVSTVEGELDDGVGAVDLLRATFPDGSITGAPKIRAMEILREIEPVRRGVYTGALGVVGFNGDMKLSVGIRTAVVRDGYATYGTGGGITLASVADDEWRESEVKAWPFRRALGLGGWDSRG